MIWPLVTDRDGTSPAGVVRYRAAAVEEDMGTYSLVGLDAEGAVIEEHTFTSENEELIARYRLVKVNADLARLGNLLRMAFMDDDEEILPEGFELNELYEDIRETQGLIKAKIREL